MNRTLGSHPGFHEEGPGLRVYEVVPKTEAEKAGLQLGDIITHANRRRVQTAEDYNRIRDVLPTGGELRLTVKRKGRTINTIVRRSKL